MLNIDIIAGARPNFMKIAPIIHAIYEFGEDKIKYRLIHTGQHFDHKMSETFFEQLNIPKPDINLGAGGGTQAEQTAAIMIGYEKVIENQKSDICLVVGDVTSTMACAIVAKKAGIQVAHVEAGIRSGDLRMPEEINRLVTDSITDIFYTTSETANANLINSGISKDRIRFVGNTMIDTLIANLNRLQVPSVYKDELLESGQYFVLTLHRPSNVDEIEVLSGILKEVDSLCQGRKVIFPVHPRTLIKIKDGNLTFTNIVLVEPLGYLEFIYLVKNTMAVITDSGGITEECTVLKIPCLTLRNSTERPETVTIGTNELIGSDISKLRPAIEKVVRGQWKKGGIPALWDGETAKRIVEDFKLIA
ncbi:MAG: non-hydrolyzing UDP-N-acetylglucosamine 2-epimerase [Spirosomataceae bacterium]